MGRPGRRPWLLGLVLAGLCRVGSAAEVGEQPLPAMLDLPREGYLVGRLLDSPAEAAGPRKTFLWQSPAFAAPLEFAVDGIVGIRFPQPAAGLVPEAAGEWRIELADGGQLVGAVDAIDDRHVVAGIGASDSSNVVRVRRDAVRSLFRGGAGTIHAGSGGLALWRQSPSAAWRDEAGRLATSTPGARIFREFQAGPRARYDVSLSWRERPTLRLAVGASEAGDSLGGYRVELRPDGVVAVREEHGTKAGGGGRADLEPCGDLPDHGLTFTLFVDQVAGRLAVLLPESQEPVAELTIPPGGGPPAEGFSLSVIAGAVTLESLRVSPWRGGSLAVAADRAGSIRLRDGAAVSAVVERMEPGSGAVVVRTASGESKRIPIDTIDEILFPTPAAVADEGRTGPRSALQATDLYGSRLTGNLRSVEPGTVWLSHPGIDDPVPLPLAVLATLAGTGRPDARQVLPGRVGRLECEHGSVWGCLVEGRGTAEHADHGAIAWHPLGGLDASPLAATADGGQPRATIVYVEQPTAEAGATGVIGGIGGQIGLVNGRPAVVGLLAGSAAQRAGIRPGEMILAIAPRGNEQFVETGGLSLDEVQQLLRGRVGTALQLRLSPQGKEQPRQVELARQRLAELGRNPQLLQQALETHDRLAPRNMAGVGPRASDQAGSLLILRTGEMLHCTVEAIDEKGVRVRLPGAAAVTVAEDMVQALELVPSAGRTVTAEKFRSLTMLPRSQRQQPPTHVLRSVEGDYLRGRLVSMDDQIIRIFVEADPRNTPLAIPRVDVARLIWLHPESLGSPWEPPMPVATDGLLVESVVADTARLRMRATRIEGNTLIGESAVVGPCRIDLEAVDRLLIGGGRSEKPRSRPYAQWKLEPAPEPRNLVPQRPEGGGGQ